MPDRLQIILPLADLMLEPRRDAMRVTQALYGEALEIISSREGWAHVRLEIDGYEGFIDEQAIGHEALPDAILSVPASHAYPRPDMKSNPASPLYFGAQFKIIDKEGEFVRLANQLFVKAAHIDKFTYQDPASMALQYLHVPYLWGGKTFAGIDCSGLVQIACQACAIKAPRDSGPQSQSLGQALSEAATLMRNDLIFWPGHVGILTSADRLLHANAHYMMVVEEALETAIHRIGKPSQIRRL